MSAIYLRLKKILKDLTGVSIYRANTPWGLDIRNDISRLAPMWSPQTIFDVGANIGQKGKAFYKMWPHAKIFCFEPVQSTYQLLNKTTHNLPNVESFPLALSSVSGESTIKVFKDSRLASLKYNDFNNKNTDIERVKKTTIDQFCEDNAIEKIDLLKIDTEGNDLEVLKGGSSYLESGCIDFVLTEFSTGPRPGKVSIGKLDEFLAQKNMTCIGVYDQWYWGSRDIYDGNALFVKKEVIK